MKMQNRLDASALPGDLQSLPPAQARFCLGVERFLLNELGLDLRGSRVLAGFSGGADSTALLLALRYLARRLGCTLYAAHLDHRLRPGSSDEAESCRLFCHTLGIPLVLERLDRTDGKGIAVPSPARGVEEACRAARYAFFSRAAGDCGADWVVTGHNANDLAEDVLMRLTRGTGWPGLAGMPAMDPDRRLLRPLLLTPRKDIEGFVRALGTGWNSDESNGDRAYFRNRVRLDLLPFFLEENPAFLDSVAGLWRLGRVDEAYFAQILSAPAPAFHPRSMLAAMPKALRLRLYKKTLEALGRGQALMSGLLALDEAFTRNEKKTEHRFPGGKRAVADADGIRWSGPAT